MATDDVSPSSSRSLPAGAAFYASPVAADAAPLVIVLPGGGYAMHAPHEGHDIALWLGSIGMHAIVFEYPVTPELHPAPILATRALLGGLRDGSFDLPIDPALVDRSRIAVVGFSAGGHDAALLSNRPTALERDATDGERFERPDLAILAYPVISMSEHPHRGSVDNFLGPDSTLWARSAADADILVDASTPPTFLWHTADDGGVHVTHALSYARALAKHTIPFELHVFERGDHGKGLAIGLGPLEAWSRIAHTWLADRGWAAPVR